MKSNSLRGALVLYMSWRSMSVLCSTGCWFYRASRVLEAVFHLSAAFYGLDATFFFFFLARNIYIFAIARFCSTSSMSLLIFSFI